MSEATLVENLPEGVWELIVDALLHQARGNPGDVFRLSLVCQWTYVLVVEGIVYDQLHVSSKPVCRQTMRCGV